MAYSSLNAILALKGSRRPRRRRKPKRARRTRSELGSRTPASRKGERRKSRALRRAEIDRGIRAHYQRTGKRLTPEQYRRGVARTQRRIARSSAPQASLSIDPATGRAVIPASVSASAIASLSPLGEAGERLARRSARRTGAPSDIEFAAMLFPPARIATTVAKGIGAALQARRGASGIAQAERTAATASRPAGRGGAAAGRARNAAARTATKARRAARAADEATSARGIARAASGRPRPVAKTKPPRLPATSRARKVARVAAGTARAGGKAVTFPVRRPIKTTKYSVYAQTPAALATGDPSELTKPFAGEGIVADVGAAVGGTISDLAPGEFAQNLVKDIFELPANTPPALYIPVAAVVEAAQGDSSRLSELWEDYKAQGLIPAVLSGDKDRILETIKAHPLYAGLEARGGQAVAGRVAGAAARRAPSSRLRQLGSTKRKPLEVRGTTVTAERSYSPDLIEKGIQVVADRRRQRREGGQYAGRRQQTSLVSERVDRMVAGTEGVRRARRQEQIEGATQARPRRRIDREGVALAAQGILRSPQTFAADLAAYAARLDGRASQMRKQIADPPNRKARVDTRARLKANRQLRATVDALRRDGDAEAIFTAARANAGVLRRQSDELEELGLLAEGQGAKAAAIPFAVTHMGARYGTPAGGRGRQLLDHDGNPLPLERIEVEMRRQGVDPEGVGFVTQAPASRGPGSFYRAAYPNRQTLPKAARSGRSTREGTFDASFDAVLEQRVRNQGIIDAVKGFDRIVGELAVGGQRFRSYQEARSAVQNPRAFGFPREAKLVPVRLAPFSARSNEVRRAEERFDALDPSDQLGRQRIAEQLAEAAMQEGPGPVVLLPAQAARRLKEHYTAATTFRRAAQLVSSTFKGVVLPLSPNWILGNIVDISMRSMLSGTVPWGRDANLGRRMVREVRKQDPDAAMQLEALVTPGALIGSASRSRVHRDARQFMETRLAPFAVAMGALRRTPGPKHAVNAYRRYRDAIFSWNDRFIERQAQYAQLGKAARREVRETTGRWHKALRVGDDAIADLAKGLLKTEKQIRYAKEVERVLGQWTAHGPEARAFLIDYAPFGQWTRAASRFVFLTLPARHPIKTAMFAAAAEMTEEERLHLGLSLYADEGTRLPPNLQGSLPLADGSLLAPQTITSFGSVADWPRFLSDSILPQVPLDELAGLDWTGQQLAHEDGTPLNVDERAKAVLLAIGDAYLPFVALGRRMAEQGAYEGAVPRTLRPYDPGLVEYLRSLSGKQTIQVPASDSKPNPPVGGNPFALESNPSTGAGDNPFVLPGSSGKTPSGPNPFVLP